MTVLHYCAFSAVATALKAHIVITRAVTLFSFNASNFRPARRRRIDAHPRIKWLNTLCAINISGKGRARLADLITEGGAELTRAFTSCQGNDFGLYFCHSQRGPPHHRCASRLITPFKTVRSNAPGSDPFRGLILAIILAQN